jgi:hypothetical protein
LPRFARKICSKGNMIYIHAENATTKRKFLF